MGLTPVAGVREASGAFSGWRSQECLKGGHRGLAPVEPEHILVQVALEMLGIHPMMGAGQPGLQIAEDLMDMRRLLVSALRRTGQPESTP